MIKKGGDFTFKREYAQCKQTFLRNKKYFWISTVVFFLFIFIGLIFPVFFREEIFSFLSGLVDLFEGKNLIEVIAMIFYNNAKASFVALILGIGAGILPLIILLSNGYLVGLTARLAIEKEGLVILWRLIPHGVFEIPAILVSCGLGIGLGMAAISGKKNFKKEFLSSLKFYGLVIIPLLVLAAIIESMLIFLIG